MEAIEKAKIVEFAKKIVTQANENALSTVRLQGAKAAIDYILNLDPVNLAPEDELMDEVTDADVKDLSSYLAENEVYDIEYTPYDTVGEVNPNE